MTNKFNCISNNVINDSSGLLCFKTIHNDAIDCDRNELTCYEKHL